jgi:hypothetical protein
MALAWHARIHALLYATAVDAAAAAAAAAAVLCPTATAIHLQVLTKLTMCNSLAM